jgi:hypothetical protein
MGHAPSIATKITSQLTSETSSQDISPSHRQNRKSLFAQIIDALHRSRRLQAERTLRQYRHLIDRADQADINDTHTHSGDDCHVDK